MEIKKSVYEIVRIILFFNLIISGACLILAPIASIVNISNLTNSYVSTYIINEDGTAVFVEAVKREPIAMEFLAYGIGSISLVLIAISYVGVSYHFYCFFSNIIKERYFLRRNGIRLRIIGAIFIAICAYMLFYNGLMSNFTNYFPEMVIMFGEGLDFAVVMKYLVGMVIGLMFIIVGEAFVQGNILEEDNKLTV